MKTKTWQIQLLGLLALALLFILMIPLFAKRIPTTLQSHLKHALEVQGYDWVNVNVSGRNVTLKGNAPTAKESFAALQIIKKYTPLLHIIDQITPRIISPYTMKMDWDGKQLILKGYVANQDHHQQVLKRVSWHLSKTNVQDHLEQGAGAPENWHKLIETSLKALLTLQRGHIEITNQSLYFSGQTPSTAQKDEITQRFSLYPQYQKKLHIVAADENDLACQEKFKTLLENNTVKFPLGKALVNKSSYPLLAKLANTVVLCSRHTIVIEGHTDNKGNATTNLKLSQQRAQAVVNWLLKKGIEKEQLIAVGRGALSPIADNKTEEGRTKNRRIEFIVKGKGD
ncbi:MAG: OmpA family protein [Cocleimonas sp.]|nr:OmpA family protein [Cocleimonas sp.]